jgi:hypothetical protein
MPIRTLVGIAERVILGTVMGMILFVVERLLTSQGDVRRAQRLLRRVRGGR